MDHYIYRVNAITILVRNDFRDIMDLNECLISINENIPETLQESEVIIFHESGFEKYKSEIKIPKNQFPPIFFQEIDLSLPIRQAEKFGKNILEFFPHPTHGNGPLGYGHPGFSIGYRSMCRFFGAEIFLHPIVSKRNYEYLMRLDTDSRFLKGNGQSLFGWAKESGISYAYIRSAVQWDNFKMVFKFKSSSVRYFQKIGVIEFFKSLLVPKGKLFYTNFEICEVHYFSSERWQNYFQYLDAMGGFYLYRWGDAIFRYMGVRAMLSKSKYLPLPSGFTYQHGGIFETSQRASLRPHWLSKSKV